MGIPATVRELLAEHRQAGLPFGTAWPRALAELPAEEQQEWLEALEDTAQAWRAAFEARPATRAEWALSAVGADPERDVPLPGADPWDRICASCGDPLPAGKQRNAVYCGRECQRRFHGRQVAA